jgi:hypothetical protein
MSLPVIEGERPIGLISRNIFMSQMSKPFYHELYGKKSCIAFMDKEPLIVDAAMSIEALTFRAVESGRKGAGRRLHRDPRRRAGRRRLRAATDERGGQYAGREEPPDHAQHRLRQRDPARAAASLRPRRWSDTLDDAHLEWQPRDVVGGDFYHFARYPDGWFAAIADCTGHGVPGAFMTLDLVVHLDAGPATAWARAIRPR